MAQPSDHHVSHDADGKRYKKPTSITTTMIDKHIKNINMIIMRMLIPQSDLSEGVLADVDKG